MSVPEYKRRSHDTDLFFQIGRWRFGLQRSPIFRKGGPYMTRYIAYFGPVCLRFHHFLHGDDPTPHDHPFWFWTFPLVSYVELVGDLGSQVGREVRAFKWHFRSATFKHVVLGRINKKTTPWSVYEGEHSFWTIVVAGLPTREWGFWPNRNTFIPGRERK